ncbi:MAG: DUF4292 domain-containing protein [Bacteroides sp.]|nr:DUF4292 domain-containing protein [Bacteroides sp.]
MKNVFKVISLIIFIASFPLITGSYVNAQNPVSPEERNKMVTTVTDSWTDWETVSISGKLKMPGLSINPSLKVFMEKDSVIRISLRAPLMGEVGRAEIEGDTILVVNKMKKAYVKESIENVLTNYPITLSDLQSLLLGRVAIPGLGLLGVDTAEGIDIYPDEADQYYIMPAQEYELEEFQYAYLLDCDLMIKKLMVIPVAKPDSYVNLDYLYDDKGYEIIITYQSPEKIYGGSLIFDNPTEEGSPIEPLKLNNKYRQVTFQQFMKSF